MWYTSDTPIKRELYVVMYVSREEVFMYTLLPRELSVLYVNRQ